MKRFFCLIFLLIICYCSVGCSVDNIERFPDGTRIDGIDISHMTVAQAAALTLRSIRDEIASISFEIELKGESAVVSIAADELNIETDIRTTLESLLHTDVAEESTVHLSVDKQSAGELLKAKLSPYSSGASAPRAEFNRETGEYMFFEGKDGKLFDIEPILAKISDGIAQRRGLKITAESETLTSNLSMYELKSMHFKLAEFSTSFNKSPLNAQGRVNNIVKAADKINGIVIGNGETFDMNEALGDRNKANGWSKAPGIRNSRYEMEYGGGVCQVSSTLYNAALMSGITIVERQHHSWPVSYVPKGLDATISTDGPNLILKNESGEAMTIGATTNLKSNTITITIFGKQPSDYESIELYSKVTGTISAPEAKIIIDPSLKSGTRITRVKARNGIRTVAFKRYLDKEGNVIREEKIGGDIYRAIAAQILVSP